MDIIPVIIMIKQNHSKTDRSCALCANRQYFERAFLISFERSIWASFTCPMNRYSVHFDIWRPRNREAFLNTVFSCFIALVSIWNAIHHRPSTIDGYRMIIINITKYMCSKCVIVVESLSSAFSDRLNTVISTRK